MDPAEGSLPVAVPSAAWVHLEPRRLPGDCDQFIEAGSSPRPLLSRVLLGADGSSLCSRRDESLLDRRARYPRPPRESSAVRPRDCTDCRHRVFCRRRVDAVPAWLGKAPRRADVVWWRSAKELSAGEVGVTGDRGVFGYRALARSARSISFNFSTALSGVVTTGRPEASATISAAGAMLYCASAIRSQSARSF